MPAPIEQLRTQPWLEGLGEWSWPGRAVAAVEALPPAWVPAFPPALQRASVAGSRLGMRRASGVAQAPWPGTRSASVVAPAPWPLRGPARRLSSGALASAVAAICVALALTGPLKLESLLGLRAAGVQANASSRSAAASVASSSSAATAPTLVNVGHDRAGSAIDEASYTSPALGGRGSFLVYLPAGYANTTRHYPVLYLLHGDDQTDSSFLTLGLQPTLDRLIARHVVAPLIAVMVQGGSGPNNWRNLGSRRYESYVVEVQQLVDRMLPTLDDRAGRAIAGYSMGGYGAMEVALSHPERFGVVESWLGFFNGLGIALRRDRPLLSRLGLHAFLYGGSEDQIANPSENAPFAGALRAAGASAQSAVYPGGHTMQTLHAHLAAMLRFAGHSLYQAAAPAGGRQAHRDGR